MYIVRWLMGHPIVAIWVLLGTAILLALGSGAKEDVVADSEVSTKIEKASATVEPSTINNKTALESATNAVKETTLDEKVVAEKEDEKKEQLAKKPTSTSAPLTSALDGAEDGVTNSATNSAVANSGTTVSDIKVDTADSKETATTDISQITGEEMLLMAREAYWNNGLDEAAQIYTKLIEKEPKVLEHRGELGNVYWRQGYPKKAAELYSEIAIPMIDNGGSEKVANMIGFIGLFYPDRAATIHQRMQSKKTK